MLLVAKAQRPVNYGPPVGEDKDILGGVRIDRSPLTGYKTVNLTAHR